MRKRRLGFNETTTYPVPPKLPPIRSYPAPEADLQRYPPPLTRSANYPEEQHGEPTYSLEPIVDREYFSTRRKTVGAETKVGGYDEKVALSQSAAGTGVDETFQGRNSILNAYPRDVKVSPVELPRDI